MRVAFLVPSLQPSGGVLIAVQHARALRERAAIDAALVACTDEPATLAVDDVPVLDAAAAVEASWDVAVATWWTTWATAVELDARRRALLLQGLDERFYRSSEPFERLGATMALAGADELVAVSRYLRDAALAVRPDVRCHLVVNGLDRATFAPANGAREGDGPLRVLIEGHPGLELKGVADALAAVGEMREKAHVTLIALEPPATRDFRVHRVLGGLDAPAMAALYASSDVLLKLSRSEGLGLPPLEAAATGTPSVVTPYGGHADWIEHGANGVLVGFDDPVGTAGWLDALARDGDLRARLGAGALETATRWPTPEDSSDAMAAALRAIAEGPGADPAETLRSSARALARGLGFGRVQHDGLAGTLQFNLDLLAATQADLDELVVEHQRLLNVEQRLQDVLDSRAYKLSEGLRRFWWSVRRGRGA
jgi:glycosyltransferase involved in cell wall biosynthesis